MVFKMGCLAPGNPTIYLGSPTARQLRTGPLGHSVSRVATRTFARIKLTPSRLVNFNSMIHRNRALVGYIWFCLELDDYDCTQCETLRGYLSRKQWEEVYAVSEADNRRITTGFQNLFSSLSTWDPNGNLILDITIYSPSDSEHWFKYLTFMPDAPSQTISTERYNDARHGWVAGSRHATPPRWAIRKIFHDIMPHGRGSFPSYDLEADWWDQLPSVPAVTSILLRQQNRRRWRPSSLAHMFDRFPRLQEVHYEPRREWCFAKQNLTDGGEHILRRILPSCSLLFVQYSVYVY